ncbi:5'-3' exoribonuclease 1-like [Antedon mediterranea]|uniref:5'-3' exoribonuclease 1-like n=1 Tax=Antedon mediterranea TaxID=105859 RepID=UPI003AF6668D
MGVPKFYRWLSERYPCLSEVVKENQIPEFDNLYFDMNGIVHTCSHPDDGNVHFRITEEKIFADIFHYIEVLFRLIKPRKVFYMAIDGCAPRAKMNQQRGRRFRTAKAAEEQEKQALAKGEKLPDEKRFDSNCITPGTPFMVRLHNQLQYFISQKVTSDPLWQGIRIYLSGHETPGEGEHKIMDFIRCEKSESNYDPNTRHCLYGLDADLMILGLITHEPHFSLLREEVRFGKQAEKKRPTSAEETTFHLLHLSLLREYLDAEFSDLKKFEWYDLERVIDDWVFMGFLVGNDFIPHLPDLHINHDALPMLYRAYIEVASSLKGFINNGGELNLDRLEIYLKHLSKFDTENFEKVYVDYSFLESKKGSEEAWKSKRVEEKKVLRQKPNGNAFELISVEGNEENKEQIDFFGKVIPKPEVVNDSTAVYEELTSEQAFEKEFLLHKQDYYKTKFEMETVNQDELDKLVKDYIEALQWILYYYFNGVQSWGWYYPHHYAPYMSDLKNFKHLMFTFEKGRPFLPFQQLLGVLPAASKELLPECFQKLMIMDNSPIIDYYPVDFKTDLNGKQQDWEAVVLIPFIDEKRLLSAMDTVANQMTCEERSRNKHGPHLLFTYNADLKFEYQSLLPAFPNINPCSARCTKIPMDKFEIPVEQIRKVLCPEVRVGVYFPGFPTLHHLEYTTKLKNEEVKVFQQISRGENVILTIQNRQTDQDLAQLAKDYLGMHVFAEWPHLKEVKVVEISDETFRYKLIEERGTPVGVEKQRMSDDDASVWHNQIRGIKERYLRRKGVDIGTTYVLVHAKPLMGRRYICGSQGKVTLEKEWADIPVIYAGHMIIKNISVHDPTFQQFKTLQELFQVGKTCFMLGSPHYGHMAKVVEVVDGRIRIEMDLPHEPDFQSIISRQENYEQQYFPGFRLAQRLGISGHLLSRITGTIYVEGDGKRRINVGLNLKFNRTNQEIPGFSKKDKQGWTYSSQVHQILVQYMRMFPELFRVLSQRTNATDNFTEDEIFGDTPRLNELKKWLDGQECMKVMRVQSGVKQLGEQIISIIESEVKEIQETKSKKIKMSVRPHLLFPSMRKMGNLIPDPNTTCELFDRIINVREGYTVPFGLRGTVVGIQPAERIIDTLYDVIFDEQFSGGISIRCTGSRGYRMPPTAFINLSHGLRKGGLDVKPTAVKPVNTIEHTRHRGWYDNTIAEIGSNTTKVAQMSRKPQSPMHQQSRKNDGTNSEASRQKLNKGKSPKNGTQAGQHVEGTFTILPRKSINEENQTPVDNTSGNNSTCNPQSNTIQKEFASMWKQLQQSEKPSKKSVAPSSLSKSGGKKQKKGVSSTLVKPAAILNTDPANISITDEDTNDGRDDRNSLTVDKVKDDNPNLNNQEKEIYLQKGTEDLCRLLNISKPESVPSFSKPLSYGKQINVSQLFADPNQTQPSKPELLSPAYFSAPLQAQKAAQNLQHKTGPQHTPPGKFTQIPQGQKIYQPQPTHPIGQTGLDQRYPANSHSPNQFQWTAPQHVIQPGHIQSDSFDVHGGQQLHTQLQGGHQLGACYSGQTPAFGVQQGFMQSGQIQVDQQLIRGVNQLFQTQAPAGQQPIAGQMQIHAGQQVRGINQAGQIQILSGQFNQVQGYRQPIYIQNRNMAPANVRMPPQQYQRQPGYGGAMLQPRGPPTGPNQPSWTRLPTPAQNLSPPTPNNFVPLQVTKLMTPTKPEMQNTNSPKVVQSPELQPRQTNAHVNTHVVLNPVEPTLLKSHETQLQQVTPSDNLSNPQKDIQDLSTETKSSEISSCDSTKSSKQRKSKPRKKSVKLAINFCDN